MGNTSSSEETGGRRRQRLEQAAIAEEYGAGQAIQRPAERLYPDLYRAAPERRIQPSAPPAPDPRPPPPVRRIPPPAAAAARAALPPRQLPELCRAHQLRGGCSVPGCRRLHLCRRFVADICSFGPACRHGHSLTTVHNTRVCDVSGLSALPELVLLQRLRDEFAERGEMPPDEYRRHLERCFKFGSANPCDEAFCNRLHLCRRFLDGTCNYDNCKFGHDLHTTHNNAVLSRHKATRLSDQAICDLLREKSATEQGATGRAVATDVTNRPQRQRGGRGAANQNGGRKPAGRGNQNGGKKNTGAQNAQKDSKEEDGISEELQCPVCLELFNKATVLGCGHTFCADCVEGVGGAGARCPMCRTFITSYTHSITLDNVIRNMKK